VEDLFKKYSWVVRIVGLVVVVAFAGSALATWLGARRAMADEAVAGVDDEADSDGDGLDGDGDDDDDDDELDPDEAAAAAIAAGASPGDDPRVRARAKQSTAGFLVGRNVFCPTCQPVDEAPASATDPAAPVQSGVLKSSLPLALIATMESDDPSASMATIQDMEQGSLGSYGVLDTVRPNVTLAEIGRGRVILLNGRQREYIVMADRPAPPQPELPELPKPRKDTKTSSSRSIEGAEDAIKCEGDSCTIDRDFLNKALGNPAMLAKQARVVPSIKDGETRGFKFYGVRPGSLPRLLGVKNGDMVKSINGQPLTSVDEAMGMYAKMRGASSLSVVIERRGATVTKDITIK